MDWGFREETLLNERCRLIQQLEQEHPMPEPPLRHQLNLYSCIAAAVIVLLTIWPVAGQAQYTMKASNPNIVDLLHDRKFGDIGASYDALTEVTTVFQALHLKGCMREEEGGGIPDDVFQNLEISGEEFLALVARLKVKYPFAQVAGQGMTMRHELTPRTFAWVDRHGGCASVATGRLLANYMRYLSWLDKRPVNSGKVLSRDKATKGLYGDWTKQCRARADTTDARTMPAGWKKYVYEWCTCAVQGLSKMEDVLSSSEKEGLTKNFSKTINDEIWQHHRQEAEQYLDPCYDQ